MRVCINDVSDTPLGDDSTVSQKNTAPNSNKQNKVLFPDDAAEYQVDESERNLLEKLFIEDDKNKVAWYFEDDKADGNNKPSTSNGLNMEELELLKKVELLEDKVSKATTSHLEEQVMVTDFCPLSVFNSLIFVKLFTFI